MKILWFTNTPSLYDKGKHFYNGCGWEESLELLIKEQEGIELAVSFFHSKDNEKVIKNRTTYYPIFRYSKKKKPFKKLINNWNGEIEIRDLEKEIEKVISDFQPDVIQIFGTEGDFSEVQNYTKIPVIYHIQGLINPYLNTYLPVNQSKFSFHLNIDYLANTIKGNNPAFDFKRFRNQGIRESKVLKSANYVMGRTDWDKLITKLYNPEIQYFHVDEVLRPLFYEVTNIALSNKTFTIISTLSPTIYKGIDVVLKTAKKLKEFADFNFKWEIIGVENDDPLLKHFEKSEKINHQEVNISCSGRKTPEEMIELMQQADVFVHPSYIDNSPNSVCEAQMLGLPVIACNVGGVATLIEHDNTGFLVPSNGVFELTHYLINLKNDVAFRKRIGEQSKLKAETRHNRKKIVDELLDVYYRIIENEKLNVNLHCHNKSIVLEG